MPEKKSDNLPAVITQSAAAALVADLFPDSAPIVLQEDAGLPVNLVDTVKVFAGRLTSTRQVEQVREMTGEAYTANLYSFEQVRSVYENGSPEWFPNTKDVIPPGTKRSVWGNYQIDEAIAKADGKPGVFVFEHLDKVERKGRQVNVYNIILVPDA